MATLYYGRQTLVIWTPDFHAEHDLLRDVRVKVTNVIYTRAYDNKNSVAYKATCESERDESERVKT